MSSPSTPVEHSTTGATRRERKRLANRDAIRNAALTLFLDRGFDAVSVEEVADAADVSASTVYRNFATKEDLVLRHLTDRMTEFLDVLDRQPNDLPLGMLLVAAVGDWAPGTSAQRLLRDETALIVATPALLARLYGSIVEWELPICERLAARSGRPPTDLAVRQLTALFCATVRIVIREWAIVDSEVDIAGFGRPAIEALLGLPAAQLPQTHPG